MGAVAGADGAGVTVADVGVEVIGVEGDDEVAAPEDGTVTATVDATAIGDVVGEVVAELPQAVASRPNDSAPIARLIR